MILKRKSNCLRKLLFLLLISSILLNGCTMPFWKDAGEAKLSAAGEGQTEEEGLDVWFFACSEDADSILLRTPSADIMIDTGIEEDCEALTERLREIGVEALDLLILTHPDKDHIGGAPKVLSEFPAAQVIQTACQKESALQETVDTLLRTNPGSEAVMMPQEIKKLRYGKLHLTIYPPKEAEYKNSNNYSIGVLAEYEGISFFFAGDAKKKRIEELLEENLPRVDVYKAAHHGRDNGASEELIEMLAPAYAVVTAPQAEEETARTFAELGTAVYSTYETEVHFAVRKGILDVG